MFIPHTLHDDPSGWPEFDASLLAEARAAVPPFPLDLLPEPWRGWVANTARAAGAPVDYVAQAVLGAVAGLCGAGVSVQVLPTWSEPMVLWQALVGGPASGKSTALAPLRGVLDILEDELRQGADKSNVLQILAFDTAVETVADIVAANSTGVILWQDEEQAWLAELGGAAWRQAWRAGAVRIGRGKQPPLELARFPVSLLGAIQPDRLAESLEGASKGLAARLLYAWPEAAPYCPLAQRRLEPGVEALNRLRRIRRKARLLQDPLVLSIDEPGTKAFDAFLAGLHAELPKAEGAEAAWLANGRSTVPRLAGALELLAWSGLAASEPPGVVGRAQVEAAVSLWSDYFRPHARAVLDRAAPTDLERRVRRVACWLRDGHHTEVSRENVRREALAASVNAREAESVIARLTGSGILRFVASDSSPRGGPRIRRWQVNPALKNV